MSADAEALAARGLEVKVLRCQKLRRIGGEAGEGDSHSGPLRRGLEWFALRAFAGDGDFVRHRCREPACVQQGERLDQDVVALCVMQPPETADTQRLAKLPGTRARGLRIGREDRPCD